MTGEQTPDAWYEVEAEHAETASRSDRRHVTTEQADDAVSESHQLSLIASTPVGIPLQQVTGAGIAVALGHIVCDAVCQRSNVA